MGRLLDSPRHAARFVSLIGEGWHQLEVVVTVDQNIGVVYILFFVVNVGTCVCWGGGGGGGFIHVFTE